MHGRTNIHIRSGLVRLVQIFALGFLILSVAQYGETSLSIAPLLLVILVGELVDRVSRLIHVFSNRREDICPFVKPVSKTDLLKKTQKTASLSEADELIHYSVQDRIN